MSSKKFTNFLAFKFSCIILVVLSNTNFIMNQILNEIYETTEKKQKKKDNKFYFFQFILSFSICVSFLFIYLTLEIILDVPSTPNLNYNITKLYSNLDNKNYLSLPLTDDTIIGTIEIPSIDIKYSILYGYNDELLKTSTCRFYGPLPNEYGNLCIAGHNYNNNKFFSKLSLLKNGDIIKIFDLQNNLVEYLVSDMFEVDDSNISVVDQDYSVREITLVTCNNLNKKRLIVKAKCF